MCGDENLYHGSEENRIRGVRMLIEAGASVNIENDWQPLAVAAASGNLQLVQMLLEAGADVRETCAMGYTALHSSVGADAYYDWFKGPEGARHIRSAFDCAAALLGAGADANAPTHRGTTPLLLVARVVPSHLSTRLYAVLLRGGAILNRDETQAEAETRSPYFDKVHVARSPYLDKVHDAGGWKRYEQAHRKQLVSLFAPKLRLPTDVIPLVVDFWANVGMY